MEVQRVVRFSDLDELRKEVFLYSMSSEIWRCLSTFLFSECETDNPTLGWGYWDLLEKDAILAFKNLWEKNQHDPEIGQLYRCCIILLDFLDQNNADCFLIHVTLT